MLVFQKHIVFQKLTFCSYDIGENGSKLSYYLSVYGIYQPDIFL